MLWSKRWSYGLERTHHDSSKLGGKDILISLACGAFLDVQRNVRTKHLQGAGAIHCRKSSAMLVRPMRFDSASIIWCCQNIAIGHGVELMNSCCPTDGWTRRPHS